jgi:hypothetical protein
MLTNDIKKGMRIKLAYTGWEAIMQDNLKGNTRMAEVFGWEHETGSVYSHDITHCKPTPESAWVKVEHTPAQLKLKALVEAM